MPTDVVTSTLSFPSHDGGHDIVATVWQPASADAARAPRGVVQLVHGMSEHIGRYDDFARHLVSCGFVVCGEDHIGHGRSVDSPEQLGCLPPDGAGALVENVHELRGIVAPRVAPDTPYVLFGHSMGSFISRAYLARHGQGLAAAVLCGTGQQPLAVSRAGNLLARALCALRGVDYRSSFIDGMGAGAYSKQIDGARTPFDWLNTDPAGVDAYIADPLCGFMFSVGGYAALTALTGEIATARCVEAVPKELPVLFIAGDQDPVGACGAGVRQAAEALERAGVADVTVRLYEGMRHEVLNEPGHAQVYADVTDWIGARL